MITIWHSSRNRKSDISGQVHMKMSNQLFKKDEHDNTVGGIQTVFQVRWIRPRVKSLYRERIREALIWCKLIKNNIWKNLKVWGRHGYKYYCERRAHTLGVSHESLLVVSKC